MEPSLILYVADLESDAADWFDLALLSRSPDHDLCGICLPRGGDEERKITDLQKFTGGNAPVFVGPTDFADALSSLPAPVNLVVTGNYGMVWGALQASQPLFREKVARLFLVGGYVNNYAAESQQDTIHLPIDPRLRERNPERFTSIGDARIHSASEQHAWARLLTSGEGVIWLPRDICLWRYAAPGVLENGGGTSDFLLSELGKHEAPNAPALLSALPALLLAVEPDPFAWMRLFRVVPARVETGVDGFVTTFTTRTDAPNLYVVVAIDGQSLGKLLTARLRDRPLTLG